MIYAAIARALQSFDNKIGAGRTSCMLLFPPRSVPLQVGRCAIHGFAWRSTHEVLIDHLCGW